MKQCPSCGLKMYYDKPPICEACKDNVMGNREFVRLKELNIELVKLIDDIHSYLYVKRNIVPEGKGRELIIAMENALTKAKRVNNETISTTNNRE